MDTEPSLSPRFIAYIRDFLLDRDIDPYPVFAGVDISITDDGELAPAVPISKTVELFEHVAELTANPNFGIELGKGYHFESASIITIAFLAAPNVEAGIRTLVQYDKYVDSAISVDFTLNKDLGCFSTQLIAPYGVNLKHLNTYLSAYIIVALRKATRQSMPTTEIWFTHQHNENENANEKDAGELEAFFGAPVRFGAPTNCIFFESSFLNQSLYTSNSLLYEILCNALKNYYSYEKGHYDFIDTVSREIMIQVKKQTPTILSVADSLFMTERTLRRRLAKEGLTFKEIKQISRERRARYYLQHTGLSLSEISYELGFSELSAFSRAFRMWTQETPQAFREKVQKTHG